MYVYINYKRRIVCTFMRTNKHRQRVSEPRQ